MIYTFKYKSQLFNDIISVDVAHNGHTPTELYQYVYKELFGISVDDDDDDDDISDEPYDANDLIDNTDNGDIENNSGGDLIPF